jgi:hypothetical protein
MIVFIDEEGAYHSWLARHHQGFVVDALRQPTRKQPTLHRAACADLKSGGSKKHSTTGRRLKACAVNVNELVDWTTSQYGRPPLDCQDCRPTRAVPVSDSSASAFGKLGHEVVDYVVEVALIHLDQGDALRLSVGDVAAYLSKSAAQLAPTIHQLVEQGLLRLGQEYKLDQPLPARVAVYPTAAALKTLPAYGQWADRQIEAELARLREPMD